MSLTHVIIHKTRTYLAKLCGVGTAEWEVERPVEPVIRPTSAISPWTFWSLKRGITQNCTGRATNKSTFEPDQGERQLATDQPFFSRCNVISMSPGSERN